MTLVALNLFYCPHCGRRTWGRVDLDGELPAGHDWKLFATFAVPFDAAADVLPDDDQSA